MQNISLAMVRENLEQIPEHALPAGLAVRRFQPGDEQAWRDIHLVADQLNKISPELFTEQFGSDLSLLSDRQYYVHDAQGRPVGTGTAWFNHHFEGQTIGRIHWVAILPEHQRRGIGKALMTVLCRRLRELGHQRAYLTTASLRLGAINLYQKFGFVPLIRNDNERAVWRELDSRLSES